MYIAQFAFEGSREEIGFYASYRHTCGTEIEQSNYIEFVIEKYF